MEKLENINLYDFVNSQHKITPSVRLLNVLGYAKSQGFLPIAKEFLSGDFDKVKFVNKLPNMGAKTVHELNTICELNPEDFSLPSGNLSEKNLPDSIMQMNLDKFIQKYANDRTSSRAKQRLLNIIDNPYKEETFAIKTVGDYFGQKYSQRKNLLFNLKGMGKGTFELLEATIAKIASTSNLSDEQSSALKNSKTELIKRIEERYPYCFSSLINQYKTSSNPNDINQFIQLGNKILNHKGGEWTFRLFNGESLEDIGRSSNPVVTRERVRQVTREFKKYTLDPTNWEFVKEIILSKVKNNRLPETKILNGLNKKAINFFYKKGNTNRGNISTLARRRLAKLLDLDSSYEKGGQNSKWNDDIVPF